MCDKYKILLILLIISHIKTVPREQQQGPLHISTASASRSFLLKFVQAEPLFCLHPFGIWDLLLCVLGKGLYWEFPLVQGLQAALFSLFCPSSHSLV